MAGGSAAKVARSGQAADADARRAARPSRACWGGRGERAELAALWEEDDRVQGREDA